jgi:hypothetical protein
MATVAQASGHAQAMVTMAMAIAVALPWSQWPWPSQLLPAAAIAWAPCARYLAFLACVGNHGSNGHMYHPFFIGAGPTFAVGAIATLLYI